ncbi:MAG TPA: sigma-70 family RNA polymerase sigma factor [Telluria sp.]|jgi:RNA polymerase sigma-70 factor (ECF subfamily)
MLTAREGELELIEAVLRGEPQAFDTLVAPYRRRLFLLALKIMRDPDDAEDVVQDTLILVYGALGTFRADACFFTWMFRIAYNCALGALARRKRHLPDEPEAPAGSRGAEWEVCESADPEMALAGKQMAAAMDAALDAMVPEHKTAILLHQIAGLSYGQIAATMLCPVGTVRSRISSARIAIAGKLKLRGFACGQA